MRRFGFIGAALAAAALSLSACAFPGFTASPPGAAAPAPVAVTPLGNTAIDNQAIVFAFQSFETVLDLVDAAMAVKLIKPGSPPALKIADGLETTQKWLNIASAAQKAGDARRYDDAFARAQEAFAGVRAALKR